MPRNVYVHALWVAALLGCSSSAVSAGVGGQAGVSVTRSATFQAGGCAGRSGPVRIMALGDSLTSGLHWGSQNDDSYRPHLWSMLAAGGYGDGVDFVGTFQTGDGHYDPDHQGRGGYTTGPDNGLINADEPNNLYAYIKEYRPEPTGANYGSGKDWVTWAAPDIVLLNIGTNDAESNPSVAYRRLDDLVRLIRAKAPGVVVVVSSITPNGYDHSVFRLVGVAAQRIASESDGRVLYADLYARMQSGNPELGAAPFSVSDWEGPDDHVHMSVAGGVKMAAAWYPTVVQALAMPRCAGGGVSTTSVPLGQLATAATPKPVVRRATATTKRRVKRRTGR